MTLSQSVIDAGVEVISSDWSKFSEGYYADEDWEYIVPLIYEAMTRAIIEERDDGRDYRMQAD